MAYIPTPTTKDLRILDSELRTLIAHLPDTIETAQTPGPVIAFMRAVPARPYADSAVFKRDISVAVGDGASTQPPTTVQLYIPHEVMGDGPLPVVIWSHYGGFWSAGPAQLDVFCCALAVEAGVILAAPAYRQTPENPYPAPFDDVYQLLLWLALSKEASEHSIDSTRIAIGGTSAGATLAFGVFLKYRDSGHDLAKIRLLVLDDGSYTNRSTSYSTLHNPVNKIWNANVTRFMWQLYLPDGSEAIEAKERGYAVPACAECLVGAPPTMVLAAQWDDLTNDAIAFAHRLLEAGVPTEIHTYRGTFHISDKLVHEAKISTKKRGDIVDALKSAFFED